MRIGRVALLAAVITSSFLFGNSAAAETLRIGGTGAATPMMRHVGAIFAKQSEIKIEVIPGLGSGGGIRAVADGVLDIAISGRQFKPDEMGRGLTAIAAMRTPFVLATSHRNPGGLKASDVSELFKHTKAKWPDGAPLRLILRSKGDSDITLLGDLFPGMSDALEAARLRPDVPIAATDQDNTELAQRLEGSLIGATFTQIKMEKGALRMIAIDGVEPNLENFEKGAYRYGKTLYIILPATKSAAAERFVAFLQSPQGQAALRDSGALPVVAK
jgi:phosphate transport system substrate-binding protein